MSSYLTRLLFLASKNDVAAANRDQQIVSWSTSPSNMDAAYSFRLSMFR
jgi:hypothetical protein